MNLPKGFWLPELGVRFSGVWIFFKVNVHIRPFAGYAQNVTQESPASTPHRSGRHDPSGRASKGLPGRLTSALR